MPICIDCIANNRERELCFQGAVIVKLNECFSEFFDINF